MRVIAERLPARGFDPISDVQVLAPTRRGPLGTGVAPHGDPPTEWSESRNVRWKAEIPGRGHASPIVWGDRVFLLTAIEGPRPPVETAEGERPRGIQPAGRVRFVVLALDVALEDGDYLTVRTAAGARYTRAGNLQAGPGGALVDAQGNAVLNPEGEPLQGLGPQAAITSDGRVLDGETEIGRLGIVRDPSAVLRREGQG